MMQAVLPNEKCVEYEQVFFLSQLLNTIRVDYFCIPFVDPGFTFSRWQYLLRRHIVHENVYTIIPSSVLILQFNIPPSLLFLFCGPLYFSGFPLLPSQHSLYSNCLLQGKDECVWSVWERKKDEREKERKEESNCLLQKQMNGELNILQLTNELCNELWPHGETHHTSSPLQLV